MTDVPDDLKYTNTHEWIKVNGLNAQIGITDHAQQELHEVVYVELPEVGRKVDKGEVIAAVESVKARSEIYAPVTGTVARINDRLIDNKEPGRPELLNDDPYGEGWLVEIALSDPAELVGLMSSDDYRRLPK